MGIHVQERAGLGQTVNRAWQLRPQPPRTPPDCDPRQLPHAASEAPTRLGRRSATGTALGAAEVLLRADRADVPHVHPARALPPRQPTSRLDRVGERGHPLSDPMEPLLTAKEVARVLAVPESWVREATRDGRLPHVALGRYRRYQPSAI